MIKPGDDSMSMKRDLQFHSGRLSRGTPLSKEGEQFGIESSEADGQDQDTSMQFHQDDTTKLEKSPS